MGGFRQRLWLRRHRRHGIIMVKRMSMTLTTETRHVDYLDCQCGAIRERR